MQIELIEQEPIDGADAALTRVIVQNVDSQCTLARLMIQALGRPGVDNDMEFVGSGDRWMILWTQPRLSLDETRTLVEAAIAPPARRL
jgi:hypothetical protein